MKKGYVQHDYAPITVYPSRNIPRKSIAEMRACPHGVYMREGYWYVCELCGILVFTVGTDLITSVPSCEYTEIIGKVADWLSRDPIGCVNALARVLDADEQAGRHRRPVHLDLAPATALQ